MLKVWNTCADQKGVHTDNNLFLYVEGEGREGPNTIKKRVIFGPPAKRRLNGVSLASRGWPNIECRLGSFVIFRESGTVFLRNLIAM